MEDMVKSSEPGAYMILNVITNTRYVGSSARKIYERFGQHRYALRKNKHRNKHLQSSWSKHGEDAFRFIPLENCLPNDALDVEEKWFLLFKKSNLPLYNKRENVRSQLGMKHDLVTRKKMSKALKGKKRVISPEGMANILAAVRGNKNGKACARPFVIVSPAGEQIKGKNLREFCQANGFTDTQASALYGVVRGVRPSYKGYTNPEARAKYLKDHPLKRPAPVEKTCEQCGKRFAVKASHADRRRFCSVACRNLHDKAIYSGAGNPNYRHGGRVEGVKRVRHR